MSINTVIPSLIGDPLTLTLYIHIPWCKRKCPYCDFNSVCAPADLPEDEYLAALIRDLKNDMHLMQDRQINSIFIGGGTPTLLKPKTISSLIDQIAALNNIEITIEANPGTITLEKLKQLTHAGINRLSIGVQSFQNRQLINLGRLHDAKQAIEAVIAAQQIGINNINIDLMFGLPEQTTLDALSDLEMAIKLKPRHISWYQLTIEPKTKFYHQRPQLPDEETVYEMQHQGQQLLAENGFQQYEISAYCQPNYQCQHNLNYWKFGDYLGIGAGAHSKITDLTTGLIKRYSKTSIPKQYLISNKFIATQEVILPEQLPVEFMMNVLRLSQPIPISLFTERTGLPYCKIQKQLILAQRQEFITLTATHFITTIKGRLFLNDLILLFSCI